MNENEKTVEERLKQAFHMIKTFNIKKGFPVVGWCFNSEFGSKQLYQNSPITQTGTMPKEEIAEYHAERHCINKIPPEFKLKGQNTIFVTLIPCPECLEFISNEIEKYHIIYFVDHLNKMNRNSYKKWNEKVPMVKYITVDDGVNKMIKKIENLYKDFQSKKDNMKTRE